MVSLSSSLSLIFLLFPTSTGFSLHTLLLLYLFQPCSTKQTIGNVLPGLTNELLFVSRIQIWNQIPKIIQIPGYTVTTNPNFKSGSGHPTTTNQCGAMINCLLPWEHQLQFSVVILTVIETKLTPPPPPHHHQGSGLKSKASSYARYIPLTVHRGGTGPTPEGDP